MTEPIKLIINERRVGGITVYGAISPFLKHFVYMLGTSTNQIEVCNFLVKIR
jgi:hypothetical protein